MLDRGDNSSHIIFDTLIDYVDGISTPEEVESIEAHLASGCASCRSDLDWARETISLMRTDDWVAPPADLSLSVRQAFANQIQAVEAAPSFLDQLRGWFSVRPQVAWAAAAALVLVVAFFALQFGNDNATPQEALVAESNGAVDVQSPESSIWEAVDEDTIFGAGDTIRTGDDSEVVITYPDKSYTILGSNSEMKILELSTSDEASLAAVLALNFGTTQHHVQKLVGNDAVFEVSTAAATVNVVGTIFSVDAALNGDTAVAVDEGVVYVTAQGVTVQVSAGQSTTVAVGERPAVATSGGSAASPSTSAEGTRAAGNLVGGDRETAVDDPTSPTPSPSPTSLPRDPTPEETGEAEDPTESPTRNPTDPTPTDEVGTEPLPTGTPPPPSATPPAPPPATDTPRPPQPTSEPPPPTATPPTPPPTPTQPPPPPTEEPTPYPPPPTNEPPPPTPEPSPYPQPSDEMTEEARHDVPPGQTRIPPGQEDKYPVPPGQTRTPPGQEP